MKFLIIPRGTPGPRSTAPPENYDRSSGLVLFLEEERGSDGPLLFVFQAGVGVMDARYIPDVC